MITSYQTQRSGSLTRVLATSDLVGTVYYHWYQDGTYLGMTTTPERVFLLAAGEQADVLAIDTIDPDFDPYASGPDGFPARRTLWWVRSLNLAVDHYEVYEVKGADSPALIATVYPESSNWSYSAVSSRLDDLATYFWQVLAVDVAGNTSTALVIGPELIVRRPDAPGFSVAYDAGTRRVTFANAS